MRQLTGVMLADLGYIFTPQPGAHDKLTPAKKVAWVEENAPAILRLMKQFYDELPTGHVLTDLALFLGEVIVDLVLKSGGKNSIPASIRGAVLWHGIHLAPFLPTDRSFERWCALAKLRKSGIEIERGELKKYRDEIGANGLKTWHDAYRIPDPEDSLLHWSPQSASKYINEGLGLLTERLNNMFTQGERCHDKELKHAVCEFREALRKDFCNLGDANLEDIYISPRLTDRSGNPVGEYDLLDWLCRDICKSVFVEGHAGMGKTMLLRHIGFYMVAAEYEYIPIWIKPGPVAKNYDEFVAHATMLVAKQVVRNDISKSAIEWGVKERRIIFLVDEGERWSQADLTQLMLLYSQWAKGMLVLGRPTTKWNHLKRHYKISWNSVRLRHVMHKWGSREWFSQLDTWSREGRLMRNPLIYAAVAKGTATNKAKSPVEALRQAILTQLDEQNRREAEERLHELRREAWKETIREHYVWRPVSTTLAEWGARARLLVEFKRGNYRFTHDIWRSI
jgi:hypothetical protein